MFFKINSSEDIKISKAGSFNRLKILKVTDESAGKYKFEVDGRKTEAMVIVEGNQTKEYVLDLFDVSCYKFIKKMNNEY